MSRYLSFTFIMLLFALISILILKSIAPSLVGQQLIFFLLGFSLFFFISQLDFNLILKFDFLMYLFINIGLLITLFVGNVTKGSTRWIDIGGFFHIQPSQLAIPVTSLFLSHFIQDKDMNEFKNLSLFSFFALIPAVLILVEPDLGTTVIYLLAIGSILFFSNFSFKKMIFLASFAIIGAVFSYFFLLAPYQKERISSFINKESNLDDSSYNAYQAMISVGSGQFFGRGLGQGVQSHLSFLPERHTDFIFASLSEELGFVGSALVIFLYGFVLWFLLSIIHDDQHPILNLYTLSIITMVMIQVIVNIGMNIGLFPITGITLPLISYGGSSLISILISMSIVFTHHQSFQKKKIILLN